MLFGGGFHEAASVVTVFHFLFSFSIRAQETSGVTNSKKFEAVDESSIASWKIKAACAKT
jgi:hypothetical protein